MTYSSECAEVRLLRPCPHNARTHSKKQLRMLTRSIERFGFTNPVLVDETLMILAGHGRVEAAKMQGLDTVPIVRLENMSEADKRAYVLADNQLAAKAGWDFELLAAELAYFTEIGFEIEVIGFDPGEIDFAIGKADDAKSKGRRGLEDAVLATAPPAVVQPGDLWEIGKHRLYCGDALDLASFNTLMGNEHADMAITDQPYNVLIDGHVGGNGEVKHREFAMASGEMTREEFTSFLTVSLTLMAGCLRNGAIAMTFMDWRHLPEILAAGEAAFDELKQLCVWNKSNAGQGSFYRSKHELCLVWKKGQAPHTNTFGLGEGGRSRSNVWDYAGVNGFKAGRMEELSSHPTCKPVGMIEDALKDVSRRGEIVLDPFGGSGSTLIAAEKCGRQARLMEIDPAYCDGIIARWEKYTGKTAERILCGLEQAEVVA